MIELVDFASPRKGTVITRFLMPTHESAYGKSSTYASYYCHGKNR